MILTRWIVAVGLAVGLANLLASWIERKWPGHVLPAKNRVDAWTQVSALLPERTPSHRPPIGQIGAAQIGDERSAGRGGKPAAWVKRV